MSIEDCKAQYQADMEDDIERLTKKLAEAHAEIKRLSEVEQSAITLQRKFFEFIANKKENTMEPNVASKMGESKCALCGCITYCDRSTICPEDIVTQSNNGCIEPDIKGCPDNCPGNPLYSYEELYRHEANAHYQTIKNHKEQLQVMREKINSSTLCVARINKQLVERTEEVIRLKQSLWPMKDKEIYMWKDAYQNMKDFAEKNGLDTCCYGTY